MYSPVFYNIKNRHLSLLAGIFLLTFFLPLSYAFAGSVSVSIQSLSPSTTVSPGTTVSFVVSTSGFSSPTYSISDSLSGSSISNTNINSSGNFSWTPGTNDAGTHNLTIAINDSLGDSATTTESLVVNPAPSLSIQSLSPSSSINSGMTLTFTAVATGFSSPTYSVSDSFSGSTVSNSNINSAGNFTWTPSSNDTGSHTITITASDSSGHTATASEIITVGSAPILIIQSLSPGATLSVGQGFSFTASASGFNSPSYSVSDSFGGSSVSSSNINSSGNFSWNPSSSDVGNHTITITATDNSGHTATASQTVTVSGVTAVIQSLNPGTAFVLGTTLSFSVIPTGFTNPTYTLSDSFGGSTISNADINTSGNFVWTPAQNDVGVHTITVSVTDSSGHSTTVSQQITVESALISIQSISPGTSVNPGTTLSFYVVPQGFTNPFYALTDTFTGTTLTNANINSSGNFNWTPRSTDVGLHNITVAGLDSLGHSANAEISVTVGAIIPSTVTTSPTASTGVTGYTFSASLSEGDSGPDVTALQNLLASEGFFSASATGYFGSITQAAVISFQNAHGINPIGVVGPLTRSVLNNLEQTTRSTISTNQISIVSSVASNTTSNDGYKFTNPLDVGSSGTDVTELQKRLTTEGFYSGPVTGYYGSLTQTAVESYQTKFGLQPLGNVGPNTRAFLNGGI